MKFLKNYIRFFIVIFTIPIESKISMHKSVSHFFNKGKQENVTTQEFKQVDKLELMCDHGKIIIHTWKQPTTMVEVKKTGSPTHLSQTTLDFVHHNGLLQIKTITTNKKSIATTDITIIIPEKTSVKVATKQGNIYIKNLSGIIQATTDSGNIDIIDGSGDTTIHSKHGNILIQRENMQHTEFIRASADKGSITLQVPQHINSNIQASTKNGKIYSDLLVTLESRTTKLTDAVYKQQKQQLSGIIHKNYDDAIEGNITLETKHGVIKIKNYV